MQFFYWPHLAGKTARAPPGKIFWDAQALVSSLAFIYFFKFHIILNNSTFWLLFVDMADGKLVVQERMKENVLLSHEAFIPKLLSDFSMCRLSVLSFPYSGCVCFLSCRHFASKFGTFSVVERICLWHGRQKISIFVFPCSTREHFYVMLSFCAFYVEVEASTNICENVPDVL